MLVEAVVVDLLPLTKVVMVEAVMVEVQDLQQQILETLAPLAPEVVEEDHMNMMVVKADLVSL